jgi:hypothetical protein
LAAWGRGQRRAGSGWSEWAFIASKR